MFSRNNKTGPNLFFRLIALSLFAVLAIALFPGTVKAEGLTGPNSPSKWDNINKDGGIGSGTELSCHFDNSATVFCENNETATDHNATKYWFNPRLSQAAGYDIFTPSDYGPDSDKANKPGTWGMLHFPKSKSGDYSLLYISKSETEWEGGTRENDVGTGNIELEPPESGFSKEFCSLTMFRTDNEETISCQAGWSDSELTITATYKTVDVVQVQKCDKGGLGFVLCPIQDGLKDVITQLAEWVGNILDINTSGFLNDDLRNAAQQILNVANAIYAIIFLVIIFANGLSIGIDNYTLKKMVPRLVAAIILSQFSFWLTGAFIEFGNVLGRVVVQFFAGLTGVVAGQQGGPALMASATAGLAAISVVVLLMISLFLIVIVAILVVLAILAIRWAALYVLILVAPLAFAAHVLPNTEKLWKLWWTNLLKLVMMYPIIMAIIMGSVFVGEVMKQDGNPTVIQIVGALLPFIGFLMVPKAFKWSGEIMAATGGKIASYGTKKGKESLKEGYGAKQINKRGDQLMKNVPALGNSRIGTAWEKSAGKRADRIEKKTGLDSIPGKRLEAMAARGHTGAKAIIQKKYDEELERQETRARNGQRVDASTLVRLRTALGGVEDAAVQASRSSKEASTLSQAARQYVMDAPAGVTRTMPEMVYTKPGEKAPSGSPPGTPDPVRNYFGGQQVNVPGTTPLPGGPPPVPPGPTNTANPTLPPAPHGGHP